MIWSFQGEMKKEEEEGERIKKLSMLGSDDVEGKREGEVEKVGWGNYNIGEGEGEGQEEGGGKGGGKRRGERGCAMLYSPQTYKSYEVRQRA